MKALFNWFTEFPANSGEAKFRASIATACIVGAAFLIDRIFG